MQHDDKEDVPAEKVLRANVKRRGIHSIYHYTAADHIESVFTHAALFCRRELLSRAIPFNGHGWGYSGKEHEFEDYIICSFMPHWGMIKGETRPISVIELDSSLVWRSGTIFCPGNSACNEYSLSSLREEDPVTAF